MNYRELILQLTPLRGNGEARAIVRMVLEERFGLSQTDLLLGKDTTLSADDRKEFEKIAHRLLSGEPVQYVLGFADFCGHRFRVAPEVLIPRPETEELVRRALDSLTADSTAGRRIENNHRKQTFLDLCTGSGCIAISLALACPEATVIGIDISEAALAVARQNATDLKAGNVEFRLQDILEASDRASVEAPKTSPTAPFPTPSTEGDAVFPLTGSTGEDASTQRKREEGFSLIISNPPYVCISEAAEMETTVLDHEPHLALFVPDDDPLRFYHAIAVIARKALLPGGYLFVEINAGLSEETRKLFIDKGFCDVILHHDTFGRPRIIEASQPI